MSILTSRGECYIAASNDSNFYIKFDDGDSALHLNCRHAYYYQVQIQIFVCSVNYCGF